MRVGVAVSRAARLTAQLGITATLAIALSFSLPVLVDRHQYAKAALAYIENPSFGSEATLTREKDENHFIALESHAAIAGALFGLMNAVFFLVARFKKQVV